jgi:hypothetical protein
MLKKASIIVLISLAVFVLNNQFLEGYMGSFQSLGDEIAAPAQELEEWHLNNKAPFEYRMLFPAIVHGIWNITDQSNLTFYWSYVSVSYLFLVAAALAFFWLLKNIGFSAQFSLMGVITFLLMPPLLLAYTLPVHTREDTLGYFLLCIGLTSLIRKKYGWYIVISIISVFCRETLLILPFVFLFFTNDYTFQKRVFLASLPVIAWLMIRVLVETNKFNYDPLEGFKWNIDNPLQVVAFAFITFGPLWIGGVFGYIEWMQKKLSCGKELGHFWLVANSAPWAILLIIITTFLGGIYNEIRLLYLGFPWVIILSMLFTKVNYQKFQTLMRTSLYKWYVGILVVISAIGIFISVDNSHSMVLWTQNQVPVQIWLIVGLVMTFFTLATFPLFWVATKQEVRYSNTL